MAFSYYHSSLRNKFSLVIISACFVVLLLVSLLFGAIEYRSFRQKSAEELQTLSAILADHLTQPLLMSQRFKAKEVLTALETNEPLRAAYLFDLKNRPFSQYLDPEFNTFVQQNVVRDFAGEVSADWIKAEGPVLRFGFNSLSLYVPIIFQHKKIGGLYLLSDLNGLDQRLWGLVFVVLLAGAVVVAFAWWVSGWMQGPISNPILQLAETVQQIFETGDYHLRSQKYSDDEVGQLVDGFNNMLSQIEIRDCKISEHQTYLEQTVMERTAELTLTVRDLECARAQAVAANQAKSVFLANMTHELRTPLVGVLGMNELLIDSSLDAAQKTLAESVQRSGRELLELINDILDFSKIEGGHLKLDIQEIDLLEVVEEVVTMLADRAYSKGIEVVCAVSPSAAWRVRADPQRLRQILINLLGNAIKFTQQGHVGLSLSRQENAFVFEIEDTGIGIDKEAQAGIFEAFSQVDDSTSRLFGGTGLGLSIVDDLTKMMGGQLSLRSEPKKGSVFRVELPLPGISPAFVRLPPDKRESVLLFDSNPLTRESLRSRLHDVGYTVDAVGSVADFCTSVQLRKGKTPLGLVILAAGQHTEIADFLDRFSTEYRTLVRLCKKLSKVPVESDEIEILQPLLWRRLVHYDFYAAEVRPAEEGCLSVKETLNIDSFVPEDGGKGRVLIVDDNTSTRELIGFSLVGSGWQSDDACNAEGAFTALAKQQYQLVLMDINMPGMDGLDATRKLRQQGLEIPIFALTAHGDIKVLDACLEAGMQGALRKPFRQQELFNVLDKHARAIDSDGRNSCGADA
ncbi:MAG: ATP-binding protein [Geopsychrobacter sp.]|nr:ATP-binding protein [Geopsychrobacter sp.]